MDRGQEIIGLNGAAAVLDVPPETVRRFAEEGRLRREGEEEGEYVFRLEDVLGLARELGAESAEEEIFEGEVMGDESAGNSRLPAVPFERYERLLQQGQDYKTRLEERTRQIEEIRQERDAAAPQGGQHVRPGDVRSLEQTVKVGGQLVAVLPTWRCAAPSLPCAIERADPRLR